MATGTNSQTPSVDVCEPCPPGRLHLTADLASGRTDLNVALLTGGQDRHYAVGLGTALIEQDVALEVIGSDDIDGPEFQQNSRVRFYNLHGSHQKASLARRVARVVAFYASVFRYTLSTKSKIFHILWNNKLPILDQTLLMLFYRLSGKKVVFTAHNVNAARRDKKDSWRNRIALKCQYKLSNHIFVHTKKMKDELIAEFHVASEKVTTIPYGINNAVPFSTLTREEARRKLGLQSDEKAILYFGAIKQYKGLEHLVDAFQQIANRGNYRLIIAGERKKGHEEYWRSIQRAIGRDPHQDKILLHIRFIPDDEIEVYFKAADVAVLSYSEIFQSGILILSYTFGLPVIASNVGSFAEDIVPGKTGFIYRSNHSLDLSRTIQQYFETDLYRELECRREEIKKYALSRHSWTAVADATTTVYSKLAD